MNWSTEGGWFGRRNVQIVMFIVGWIFPLGKSPPILFHSISNSNSLDGCGFVTTASKSDEKKCGNETVAPVIFLKFQTTTPVNLALWTKQDLRAPNGGVI